MPLSIVKTFIAPTTTLQEQGPSPVVNALATNMQNIPVKSNTFTFKSVEPTKQLEQPPAFSTPVMQSVKSTVQKQQFPDMQRKMTPEAVTAIRQNFGGNDDLVVKNLYKKDPDFRAEVDRYAGGEMLNLSQEAQNHFPSYILNAHYFNNPSAELPANMDITRDPTRKGETWGDWIKHVVATPATFIGGGIADAAQGFLDDQVDLYHMVTGQKYDFNDTDPFRWTREVQKIIDPANSIENTFSTAATQAQLAASMVPGPMGYALSGAAGAVRDLAQERMHGQDPSLLTAAGGAAKGIATQGIMNMVAPGLPSKLLNPANITGRIVNAGIKGGEVGALTTGASGAVDVATGKQTPGEAIMNTIEGAGVGAITGAGLQTALETPNLVKAGYSKLSGFSKLSSAKQYELAVQHGGEEAKLAMTKGVAPKDVVFLKDAPPEEAEIYQKVHSVVKDVLYNPRSTANIELPTGKLVTDKIGAVIDLQNNAGRALGAIRQGLSDSPEIDITPAKNGFVDFLAKMGITTTGNKLGIENSLLPPEATNALKAVWANFPKDQLASQASIDDIIRATNDILQNTDIDETAARMGMGVLKQNLRQTLADSLDDAVRPDYLQATGDYAKAMEVLREAKKALPFTGRQGGQYSLSMFKKDVSSGILDLRAGQLARGLTSGTEGMRSPLFDKLEGLTDNKVFVNNVNGVPDLVANEGISPYAQTTFDAKTQHVAEYTNRMKQAMGLQKTGSFAGEIKGATSGLSPGGVFANLKKLFGKSAETVFNAQDEYLNSILAGQTTMVDDVTSATNDLIQAGKNRRINMMKDLQNLTPEEQATGLIGGGGDNMPRTPQEPSLGSLDSSTGIAGGEMQNATGMSLAQYDSQKTIEGAKVGDVIEVPIDTTIIKAPDGIPEKSWTVKNIKKMPNATWSENYAGPVEATIKNGQLQLWDGVHRMAEAIRNGAKTIHVRITE